MCIKCSILVIIYGKQLAESKTLTSFLNFKLSNCQLYIFNNGPSEIFEDAFFIKLEEVFEKVSLINEINNAPLSLIYNGFISANQNADRILLLDDDSEITSAYIDVMNNKNAYFHIELPKIINKSDNETYYPCANNMVVRYSGKIKSADVVSIGSGIILDSKFFKNRKKLFNESYALYGVDTSFFMKLREIVRENNNVVITSTSHIYHSLSRTENTISRSRQIERMIDLGLTLRHYPSIKLLKAYCSNLLRFLLKLDIKCFCILLKSFIVGVHPRCKNYKNNDEFF